MALPTEAAFKCPPRNISTRCLLLWLQCLYLSIDAACLILASVSVSVHRHVVVCHNSNQQRTCSTQETTRKL